MRVAFVLALFVAVASGVQLAKGSIKNANPAQPSDLVATGGKNAKTAEPSDLPLSLLEIAQTGDAATLGAIRNLVKDKLLPDLDTAVKNNQKTLDGYWSSFDTCVKAVPTCTTTVSSLKTSYESAKNNHDIKLSALNAAKKVTAAASCKDVIFDGPKADDEITTALSNTRTYLDTQGRNYESAFSTWSTSKTAMDTAKTKHDEKKGKCSEDCTKCKTTDMKTYNDFVHNLKTTVLPVQKQDFQVYKLIDCVAEESSKTGGGDSGALASCKTKTFDDSAIAYTFKDAPRLACPGDFTGREVTFADATPSASSCPNFCHLPVSENGKCGICTSHGPVYQPIQMNSASDDAWVSENTDKGISWPRSTTVGSSTVNGDWAQLSFKELLSPKTVTLRQDMDSTEKREKCFPLTVVTSNDNGATWQYSREVSSSDLPSKTMKDITLPSSPFNAIRVIGPESCKQIYFSTVAVKGNFRS